MRPITVLAASLCLWALIGAACFWPIATAQVVASVALLALLALAGRLLFVGLRTAALGKAEGRS